MFTGGIDKLEVCIPTSAQFTDGFHTMYQEARKTGRFKADKNYFASVDLRPYGVDAIFYEGSRFRNGNGDRCHKLELVGIGSMNSKQIINEVTSVFDELLSRFRVYRVDFFVDLPGVTVDELRSRIRFKYKRTSRSYGQATPESESITHTVQTVMLGTESDLVRFYDKSAQRRLQYAKQRRLAWSQSIETASFLQTFGHDEHAVITRIERQMRGKAVPANLRTLENLMQNVGDFDPFARVEILEGGGREPRIEDYDVGEYLQGKGLRAEVERLGYVEARRRFNKNRNAARIFKKFAEFMHDGESSGVGIPHLGEAFRGSVREQLSAQAQNHSHGIPEPIKEHALAS